MSANLKVQELGAEIQKFRSRMLSFSSVRAIPDKEIDSSITGHLKRLLDPGGRYSTLHGVSGLPTDIRILESPPYCMPMQPCPLPEQPKKIHPGGIYKTGMKSEPCPPEKGRKHTYGQTGFRDWKQLPVYLLQDILNRLEDAKVVANAQLVCRDFGDAGNQVRSLRLTVLESQHSRARNRNVFDLGSLKSGISDGAESSSSRDERSKLKLKDQMVKILITKRCIEQLRIEVEPKLQAKTVPEDEKRRTDFWLSDPFFVKKWLSAMQSTLVHVCLVDYGQQAIMRRSSIIRVFSNSCKGLKTLDLRNMFIDTSDCEKMPSMLSLTWRCVKVTAEALQDINEIMPNLQTLALLGVFGVDRGTLAFQDMKVLCLGLSTTAKEVVIDLPKLEKLQLKMQCPEKLIISANKLKYVAFNLEVMAPSKIELRYFDGLQELLYGASSFVTLSALIDRNPNLKMIFLDIPCMALAEDGKFLGVLKDVPLLLPDFSKLHDCEKLEVLNIGPGMWYCMETKVDSLTSTEKWPRMSRLILHMIPQNLGPALRVLRLLLRPSVKNLVVRIHTSSPVTFEELKLAIEAIAAGYEQQIHLIVLTWTMSLDFSCFSF